MASNSQIKQNCPSNLYVVILAGGNGERLWPLSLRSKPKQLLSIGSNDQTLLEQAIQRALLLVSSHEYIWIVTTSMHEAEITRYAQGRVGRVIVEPSSRNTGPAIAYCTLLLDQQDKNATVLFVPADAYIPEEDNDKFTESATNAVLSSQKNDAICLLGVKPTFAATGYGYIEIDESLEYQQTFKVKQFREKPNQKFAETYYKSNNMLWNLCMFAGTTKRFIQEFECYAPEVLQGVRSFLQREGEYEAIASIAIDYAIMEKSDRIWVAVSTFEWCDVGNLAVFLTLKRQYSPCENLILIDSKNNLVEVPEKLVALIDVDDLCIVQTSDALLITKKQSAEKVRELISFLKKSEWAAYL